MILLKNILISPRVILLFLMLLGSSSSVISANEIYQNPSVKEDQQEIISRSLVGEQINNLFDSILPYQKNLLFVKASLSIPGEFDTLIENHTIASLNYIRHSRYILPSLGIKELIFPFHIFL